MDADPRQRVDDALRSTRAGCGPRRCPRCGARTCRPRAGAIAQLYSAVRAPPTWKKPVGDGAKRRRSGDRMDRSGTDGEVATGEASAVRNHELRRRRSTNSTVAAADPAVVYDTGAPGGTSTVVLEQAWRRGRGVHQPGRNPHQLRRRRHPVGNLADVRGDREQEGRSTTPRTTGSSSRSIRRTRPTTRTRHRWRRSAASRTRRPASIRQPEPCTSPRTPRTRMGLCTGASRTTRRRGTAPPRRRNARRDAVLRRAARSFPTCRRTPSPAPSSTVQWEAVPDPLAGDDVDPQAVRLPSNRLTTRSRKFEGTWWDAGEGVHRVFVRPRSTMARSPSTTDRSGASILPPER